MPTESRLKKLEELLGVTKEDRIILTIENDYKFDDEEEEKRFVADMGRKSLIVEISLEEVNAWRRKK